MSKKLFAHLFPLFGNQNKISKKHRKRKRNAREHSSKMETPKPAASAKNNVPNDSPLSTEERANLLKGKFLTDISHQIRTPMSGIIGMTDLLMAEDITGQQLHYVTEIRASALNLMSLMNDVLDYAKITEGKMRIEPVDMELRAFIKSTVSSARVAARSKGLSFTEKISVKPPEYIRADSVRLKQVLSYLLSNALRTTREGGIRFSAKIEDGSVLFEVSDTGMGVKPEDAPLLFTAFGRGEHQRFGAMNDDGLGLAIAKRLVELMGGTIWFESEYGKGSRFYVAVPYVPGDGESAGDNDSEAFFAPGVTALVVDDIQTNLTVTAGLLRMCGITADVALSGAAALKLAGEKSYDIVFMDHIMPEMDGVEAMEKIRAMGGVYTKLPFIALTASAADEAKEYLLGAGMDGFLPKPIDKAELVKVLKKWLPGEKTEPGGNDGASGNAAPKSFSSILSAVSQIGGIDIKLALGRIGGMQDVLEQSIKQLMELLSRQISEMESALSANNLKNFSALAHGLKGSLSNIGAVGYAEQAAELERLASAESETECRERFPEFSSSMRKLAAELNDIFEREKPPENAKPEGSRSLLIEKAKEAASLLESFEAAKAIERLDEALAFTYGEAEDKLLKDAKSAAERFDYKTAAGCIENFSKL